MKIDVYLLNSFCIESTGGNPAGVVLNTANFTNPQKKSIAQELGFSETAFVQESDKADFKVTFFTPTEEIDLCGHATIATYALLLKKNIINPGEYTQELKAGLLKVRVKNDGTIIMGQRLPNFKQILDPAAVADVLKIPTVWIMETHLTPQVVSTGLNDLIIPIDTREHLFLIKPNDTGITDFEKKHGLDSLHIFTLDTVKENAIAHSRNFDPLHGIHEESATGSSTGALACYLYKSGKTDVNQLHTLVFEQGYSMKQPSHIVVSLEADKKMLTRVQVGGKAIITGEKEIII